MTRNKTADLMRDGPPPGKTHPCPTCGTPVLTATGNRYCSLACLEATPEPDLCTCGHNTGTPEPLCPYCEGELAKEMQERKAGDQ